MAKICAIKETNRLVTLLVISFRIFCLCHYSGNFIPTELPSKFRKEECVQQFWLIGRAEFLFP